VAAAKECPALTESVMRWLYEKAQPAIASMYQTLTKTVAITSRKTWKTFADWGELDVDIYYTRVGRDLDPEQAAEEGAEALEKGELWHVKLTAQLSMLAGKLRVEGLMIDWLDGKPVVLRSWQGDLELTGTGSACNVTIRDAPVAPLPPSRGQQRRREPKKATG
jgi:hypothetical protein